MTLTTAEVFTLLSTLATEAQATGLVPGGTPTLMLGLLAAGLKTTLASGMLTASTPIAIEDIGVQFDAAVQRMRDALAQGGTAPA